MVETRAGNIKRITINSNYYPEILKQIYDPPPVLFTKGKPLNDPSLKVAIVGTRRCSAYGKVIAEQLAYDLAQLGITVVSGMARGIDSAAHRGALKADGNTIAVIGCGLDVVYPSENEKLYQEIISNGTLCSEQTLGTPPLKYNFPSRNRIISGFSLGVIIVEAPLKSGTMITADFALEQGRDVMVVPGSIKSSKSKGCHRLLKQGAYLVEDVKDILDVLNIEISGKQTNKVENGREGVMTELSADERAILTNLGWELKHIDEVLDITRFEIGKVTSLLAVLETKGWVRQEAGKRFLRVK